MGAEKLLHLIDKLDKCQVLAAKEIYNDGLYAVWMHHSKVDLLLEVEEVGKDVRDGGLLKVMCDEGINSNS